MPTQQHKKPQHHQLQPLAVQQVWTKSHGAFCCGRVKHSIDPVVHRNFTWVILSSSWWVPKSHGTPSALSLPCRIVAALLLQRLHSEQTWACDFEGDPQGGHQCWNSQEREAAAYSRFNFRSLNFQSDIFRNATALAPWLASCPSSVGAPAAGLEAEGLMVCACNHNSPSQRISKVFPDILSFSSHSLPSKCMEQ